MLGRRCLQDARPCTHPLQQSPVVGWGSPTRAARLRARVTRGRGRCLQLPFFPPLQRAEEFTEEVCRALIRSAAGQAPLPDLAVHSIRPWTMSAEVRPQCPPPSWDAALAAVVQRWCSHCSDGAAAVQPLQRRCYDTLLQCCWGNVASDTPGALGISRRCEGKAPGTTPQSWACLAVRKPVLPQALGRD